MYNHVFIDKHHLEQGFITFLPDYHMAESFRRLREGKNILEHDVIMVKHEALEYDLMKKYPKLSYREAHDITNMTYNYQEALIKWLNNRK